MLGGVAVVISVVPCNRVSNDVWNGNCAKAYIKHSWMYAVFRNNNSDLKISSSYLTEASHCSEWKLGTDI